MRIVFLGPPGAGKGTQSQRLVEYLGVPHLSSGEMLRRAIAEQTTIGKLADEYIRHGRLVPDPVILQVIGERLQQPDCEIGCLFDGFPRTLGQAETLDEYLNEQGTPLDLVVNLSVPEEVLIDRLLARGRGDDCRDTIRQRFQDFKNLTTPLLKYYQDRGLLRHIDAVGSPDEVFERIRHVIDDVRQSQASSS